MDDAIKAFFGGNALLAIVVLGLIMILLFMEGTEFLPQNRHNLQTYRRAGLEYVDILRAQVQDHTALSRYLSDIRLRQVKALATKGMTLEQMNAALAPFDAYAAKWNAAIDAHQELLSSWTERASATKTRMIVSDEQALHQAALRQAGRFTEANAIRIDPIDFIAETCPLKESLPSYRLLNAKLSNELAALSAAPPVLADLSAQAPMKKFIQWTHRYTAGFAEMEARMATWDPMAPVPWYQSATSFLLGANWLTASFWQDWYGVIPLFVGSLMISLVALLVSVPISILAAIYINQVATGWERTWIKPYIELIAAIPSVVLGFFGIAILGQTLRTVSGWPLLSWVPFFPMSERLTIFTAGSLLAFMAVPTIFTLAEDALHNVPRAYVEASSALGATRWQTICKIMVPTALSGIISAILLGLGRVIGETMVVLLCSGGRIAIPDFTTGLGAFFQPAHTMTGIIAQEMGEVVRGSIHYRALFMVGILLFFIALAINSAAQRLVKKYQISAG